MTDIDNLSEKQLKIVIAGNSATGKTCILHRFCNEEFSCLYYPTAGVDFLLKRCVVQGDRHVRVVLWDIGGTTLQSEMLNKYIYAAHAILFVFDITNALSFQCLPDWLKKIRPLLPEKLPVFGLVANKWSPLRIHRRQFPIMLAYAITGHKAKGQTIEYAGVDLRSDSFTHGQLYVSLSRVRNEKDILLLVPQSRVIYGIAYTKNIVYSELLS